MHELRHDQNGGYCWSPTSEAVVCHSCQQDLQKKFKVSSVFCQISSHKLATNIVSCITLFQNDYSLISKLQQVKTFSNYYD